MKPKDTSDGAEPASVAALKQQIAALEEALRAPARVGDRAAEAERILHTIMDHIPFSISWKGQDLTYLGCNQRFADDANLPSPADIVGKTDLEMVWRAQADLFRADDRAVMDSGVPKLNYEEVQEQADGRTIWVRTSKIPLRDASGEIVAVLGMYEDITASKEAQAEQLRLQQAVILAQKRTLRLLSAPLIPISDGVVALVLVGPIDDERGARITETLLQGIAANRAAVVIIDITGVKDVGAKAARVLVRAARAAELLGAKVVLTGIGPEAARSIVEIGADLGQIETLGNLQTGIEAALEYRRGRTG